MTTPRRIPSIDSLGRDPAVGALEAAYGREVVIDALRAAADGFRRRLADGQDLAEPGPAIVSEAARQLQSRLTPSLRPVINATGIVLHTNLGRAPLSAAAAAQVVRVATGYSNLEYDLATGIRGHRSSHAAALLRQLTGAEAALVVNNTAAATLLALSAIGRGREVLISRGELVEIGGGFRVPEVMAQSGARLREVGTTNRTRLADFAAALTERTAAILRVHPSNFRISGFTERTAVADLVALGRKAGIPVIEDLGSGYTGWSGAPVFAAEPQVRRSLELGVGLVMFSGDKLLGGPQAGILAGEAPIVERLSRHPLLRAVRVDKMTLAALEATLVDHVAGRAAEAIPVVAMLTLPSADIDARATAMAAAIASPHWQTVAVIDGGSAAGGGSTPDTTLPTRLVALTHASLGADALAAALRQQDPPVIARIDNDRVVLDLRTVPPAEDALVATMILRAARADEQPQVS